MSLSLGRTASAATLLMLVSLPARGQDPVRLPGVNVTGVREKPGPRLLIGIVVDTGGNPISGAEVSIPELTRRIYSRGDGTFRFDSIPRGQYLMRARKIGYAATRVLVDVDSTGGIGEFQLLPVAQALPSMVSRSSRGGISGRVSDMGHNFVAGAEVTVLGAGLSTKTDAAGNFFLPAKPGGYMLSVAKDSFTTRLVGVTVPRDSGRHVEAWIMRGGAVAKDKAWIVEDLSERQAWIRKNDRFLFTQEDLEKLEIEWAHEAVSMTAAHFNQREPWDRDCMVVVNGGPEMANLATLTVEDVETIEVYRSFVTRSPTVSAAASRSRTTRSKGGGFLQMTNNARWAIMGNGARHCPGVYVWLR